jgi:phosphoglycerate dehydrogenase-like enzyme
VGRINILSVMQLSTRYLERIRSVSPRLHVSQLPSNKEQVDQRDLSEVDILYGDAVPTKLERAPRLKWIQLNSAGIGIPPDAPIMKSDIVITTTSGIHVSAIAEYIFSVILAFTRRLFEIRSYQSTRAWPSNWWYELPVSEDERPRIIGIQDLRGRTLGIVGYGSVGREVGRLAKAFGMRVLAAIRLSRHGVAERGYRVPGTGDPDGSCVDEYFVMPQLRRMLAECDVIVLTVPLTAETERMIAQPELRAMKPEAYLINVARGQVVDEPALISALREKRIAGAALDVFWQEPLPANSELLDLDNVILSPHLAAASVRYDDLATELFAENLRRYLAGESLFNVVDKQKGY